MTASHRFTHLVDARSNQAARGNRPAGAAGRLGQGVQPQPPEVRPPQRAAEGSGGAVHRGAATAEQAPQGAVRWMGGEAPPATRSAATPGRPARSAGRPRRGRGPGVQPGGAAQDGRTRSDRAAQPLPGVAALRAAGPRGRQSRLLEAAGREGAVKRADAASSRGSAGEAALAAGAKRRPARCLLHCASIRSYKSPIEIAPITSYIDQKRSRFEGAFVGGRP